MNVTKGFYDIQVNGYAGIDFNQNDLTVEDLHFACERIKEDGVKGILATIITAGFEDMKIRLANIALYQKEDAVIDSLETLMNLTSQLKNLQQDLNTLTSSNNNH
jgi:N-acetylglucosamine-6-phosphate deacetylase